MAIPSDDTLRLSVAKAEEDCSTRSRSSSSLTALSATRKMSLEPPKTASRGAYAERATGDYLWQVDMDEFYRPEEMHIVLDMLAATRTSPSCRSKRTLSGAGTLRQRRLVLAPRARKCLPPAQVGARVPLRHAPAPRLSPTVAGATCGR